MNIKKVLVVLFSIAFTPTIAQKFVLPPLPAYDKVKPDTYGGKPLQKEFFLDGKKVLEIGYNSGDMFYGPFFHSGGGKDDSVYTYFRNDAYEMYTFNKGQITREQFSENSTKYVYHKFDEQLTTLEKGEFYIVRDLANEFNAHNRKYRIGQWVLLPDEEEPYHKINFDKLTVDDTKLTFTGNKAIISTVIEKAKDKLHEVYGQKFVNKYVLLNLDESAYITYKDARPEHPSGRPLLYPTDGNIEYVELTYDILLDDFRFNVIRFRLDKSGNFLGRTHFPSFVKEYFFLTQGLDSKNNGRFHTSVLHWKDIAKQNDFDITSKEFNVRMQWTPTESNDHDGNLRLVLEQSVNTETTNRSFTRYLKQLYINPWTGEIEFKKDETSETGIELDID